DRRLLVPEAGGGEATDAVLTDAANAIATCCLCPSPLHTTGPRHELRPLDTASLPPSCRATWGEIVPLALDPPMFVSARFSPGRETCTGRARSGRMAGAGSPHRRPQTAGQCHGAHPLTQVHTLNPV